MLNRRLVESMAALAAQMAFARIDMRDSISNSRKTITESRELMAQVDAMLERDKIIGSSY